MPRKKKRFETNGTKLEANPDKYDWAKEIVEKCPNLKIPICRDSLSKLNSDVIYLRIPDGMTKLSKYIAEKAPETFINKGQVIRTAMSTGLEILKLVFLEGRFDYYGKELCEYLNSQNAVFQRMDRLEMIKFRVNHLVDSVKNAIISEETAYEIIDNILDACEPDMRIGVEKGIRDTLYKLNSPDIYTSYKASKGHLKSV